MSLFVDAHCHLDHPEFEKDIDAVIRMAKEAGVNPLVTIVSLLVGFQLAGVMGAVLAIPFYLLFRIALSELKDLRNP